MGCGSSVESGPNTVVQANQNTEPAFSGKLTFDTPSSQPAQTFQPVTAQTQSHDTGNHPDFSKFKPASEMQVQYQAYQPETQVHYEQKPVPTIQPQPQVQPQFQQQAQPQFQQQTKPQVQQQTQPQFQQQTQPQVQQQTQPGFQQQAQSQGQHQVQPFPPQHAQNMQQYQQQLQPQQAKPQVQPQVQQQAQPQVQHQVQPFPPQHAQNMQEYQQYLQKNQTQKTQVGQPTQQNQFGQQQNQFGQQQNQFGQQQNQFNQYGQPVQPVQQFQPKPVEIIPPKDEAEQIRETVNGVTYNIGVVSKMLKSISIDASLAKHHIPDLEQRVRKENKWLSAITIIFNLNENDLMDYFITDVFKTSNYTSFTIVFEHFMMFTPQALQNFGRVIASTNLEKLSLTHNGYDANDMSLALVMPGLQRLNQTLKVLRLSFTSCLEMTDQAFIYIKDAIEQNQVLENFSVSFGNTTNISMQSLVYLQSALRYKPNLAKLELNFMNMEHFNDAAFPIFTEIIRALPKLDSLDISTLNAGYSQPGFSNFAGFVKTLRLIKLNLFWKDEPNAKAEHR